MRTVLKSPWGISPPPLLSQQCMPDSPCIPPPIFCPIYINFSPLFSLFVLFCFQLSNGYYHCSLSSGPSLASVGAGPSPHFPPVSHAWTRASSSTTLLPDCAHYYTIGPGMLPSSKIPSWKVCVSFFLFLSPILLSISHSPTLLQVVASGISFNSRSISLPHPSS